MEIITFVTNIQFHRMNSNNGTGLGVNILFVVHNDMINRACLKSFWFTSSYPWMTTIHMETWWTRTSLYAKPRTLPCTCPPMCLHPRVPGQWPQWPCRTSPHLVFMACPPRVTLRTAMECPHRVKGSLPFIMEPTCHLPWGTWWWGLPPTAHLIWATVLSILMWAPSTWCPHPQDLSNKLLLDSQSLDNWW